MFGLAGWRRAAVVPTQLTLETPTLPQARPPWIGSFFDAHRVGHDLLLRRVTLLLTWSRPPSSRRRPYFEVGCLLLVSSLITARQFSRPEFPSCVIDDSILQMSWVNQFTQTIQQGVWLPRWMPDSNGGYGSPIFVFYSPLVYYVTALLQLT